MPTFEPFAALRYPPAELAVLDEMVCPPYDVISAAERKQLEARHPHNIIRLELPVGPDPYAGAAALAERWRRERVLQRDATPAFYGYRMTYGSSHTLGVIGALQLEAPGGQILPHEETTPKAKTDRLELLRATRMNTSPIWGLTLAPISRHLTSPEKAEQRAIDDSGVLHEVWSITDRAAVQAISAAVGSQPMLIADGHHRYECALAYRDEGLSQAPGAASIMALVVELSGELYIGAIHRVVSGLPAGFDPLSSLAQWFELEPISPEAASLEPAPDAPGLTVLTKTAAWLAKPLPSLHAAAARDLDSARMEVVLAGLRFGALTYEHSWGACIEATAADDDTLAFGLRPATLEQIRAVAADGTRMPAKTTYFWPKPRTGMVLREL